MLSYFLKNSELGELSAFISPALFRVIPLKELTSLAAHLAKTSKEKRAPFQTSFPLSSVEPNLRGETILKAYFRQIFVSDSWTLDFRTKAWRNEMSEQGRVLKWVPLPIVYDPQPAFLLHLRNLYLSFYRDDDALFSETLASLDLLKLKIPLKAHFGEGDQSAVSFSLKQFQKSFERVFKECNKLNLSLGRDFIALGTMLLCLYESLETLGQTYNVRASFESAIEVII